MKIMFQGDSITDADRNRTDNHFMAGYTQFVKDKLPKEFELVNYGISGDTSRQVLARHLEEINCVKPDILVLLVGINDVWRNVEKVESDATTSEEFIDNTLKIINESKRLVPNLKIIFIEPFLLPGSSGIYEGGFELYKKNMSLVKQSVPQLVEKYISLQDFFMMNTNEQITYIRDGVHPNENGQKIMANYVVDAINELIKQ